jgi:hypothetical protein
VSVSADSAGRVTYCRVVTTARIALGFRQNAQSAAHRGTGLPSGAAIRPRESSRCMRQTRSPITSDCFLDLASEQCWVRRSQLLASGASCYTGGALVRADVLVGRP